MKKKGQQNIMLTQVDIDDKQEAPLLDTQLKHSLLKEFEPEVLTRIKKGFDLYKGQVKINQFIVIMIDVLFQQRSWKKYSKEVLTFIQLFLLIDLNHLEKIKFQDFTNYLIDREINLENSEECQFFPAENLDNLDLQTEKVFELANCQNLGLLANNKKNVQVLERKTYKCIRNITFGGVIINNMVYIQSNNVYCLSTNDKHLNFYETVDNTLVRRFSVPDSIFFMLTVNVNTANHSLICGSTNGHLYQFSIKKLLAIMDKKNRETEESKHESKKAYPPHEQYRQFMTSDHIVSSQPDLTCLDYLESLELLVTGSNDSKVRLYEFRESGLHLSKELDGHYKGVKGVAVSIHHKLIVSCSFDFDVLVWNAYLEHPVARLEGHQAPLMSVACPKKHQIIISLDAKSVMKIWSCENYQLIQNIVIYQNFPPNSSINFLYKNQTSLAIVYTKKLKFYEYIVSYNPKLTDDQDLTSIKYSSQNLQVYIGSKRSLKVWSIKSGVQIKCYKNIVESDISIIEIDDRERRCFLGTITGQIVSLDIFSGLVINTYSSHGQEVSLLLYNNLHKLLISGGWDRRIKIHNDTHHLEKIEARENVMRNINNVAEKDLNGGCFSLAQLFIVTHCKTNTCKIWDFEKGFLESQIVISNEISLTAFVDPLPILIVIDVKGTIYIFSTKYMLKSPYKLLTQWKNMYSIQKSSQITFISAFFQQGKAGKEMSCQLILGDEYGYVRIVDISQFIIDNEIKPVTLEMLGNKNPYRIEDYHYLGLSENSVNTHSFLHLEFTNIVPPPSIKQKLQIKAHNDRVNYVVRINQSQESMLLSAGSDNLVKIWNINGEPRGTMRQGLKENKHWSYFINKDWCNRETIQFQNIKKTLNDDFDDYLLRKRMEVIPFTNDITYEEANNDLIYKNLKEVEGYLQKPSKKGLERHY